MSTVEHAFEWWWQRCDISEEEIKWEVFDGFKAGWQASREALVVDLPVSTNLRNNEVIKAVGRHIHAQGLKVKP